MWIDEEEYEEETIFERKIHRYGATLFCVEYTVDNVNGEGVVIDERIVWRLNLYLFIQIPMILLSIAFVIFLYEQRYQACMELFDSFWYCALR